MTFAKQADIVGLNHTCERVNFVLYGAQLPVALLCILKHAMCWTSLFVLFLVMWCGNDTQKYIAYMLNLL